MNFLPIVERELRVAARKRSTFWLRIVAALVALVIGCGFLALTKVGFMFGTLSLGKGLFAVLTWLCLAAVLSAGPFFTSDCLSEEKRDGTLGFLFLTDLRGHDVVLGKLTTTSLRGFYALLAVFPILAITLVMGGVTGAVFGRTFLALISALFVSLAAGMFVSAICRDSQKALGATVVLLALLIGGGPLSDAALAAVKPGIVGPLFSLSSPYYLFRSTSGWGGTPFWLAFLTNQTVAWVLLGLACVVLPRTWQAGPGRLSSPGAAWARYRVFGWEKRRHEVRRKLIEHDPILWLACREDWRPLAFWGLTILVVIGFVAVFAGDDRPGFWMSWSFFGGALTLALYLWITSQAARFFVEVRRSGLVEVLLVTPLRASQIVQGHWRALLRMFGLPLALCLAAELLGAFLVQQKTWNSVATTFAAIPPPTAMPTNAALVATNSTIVTTTGAGFAAFSFSGGGLGTPNHIVLFAMSLAEGLRVLANLIALIWFGMWMGLTSKNTNLAALKAFVFVQIIPWLVVSFVSGLAVPLFLIPSIMRGGPAVSAQMMVWYPLIFSGLSTALCLTKDIVFSLWARRKLFTEFRERTARVVGPVPPLPPPLWPRAAPPPPTAKT